MTLFRDGDTLEFMPKVCLKIPSFVDRGTRIADLAGLIYRNRRRNAVYCVYPQLVHVIRKLPRVDCRTGARFVEIMR